MIVDDRLETVLRTAAAGPSAMRTQFRQLIDLLGRAPADRWTALHSAALERIDQIGATLGDGASAALIGTCTLRSPRLVAHLGAAGPKVALAAIVAARLPEAEWQHLIPELPVQARGFLRHRRDLGSKVEALLARFGITDFALPLPTMAEPLVIDAPDSPRASAAAQPVSVPPVIAVAQPVAVSPPMAVSPAEGISAIIQRIEEFRRARSADLAPGHALEASEAAGQSRLPFADEPLPAPRPLTALDLRLDGDGTVIAANTADAVHVAVLVGLRPFAPDPDAPVHCDAASIRAARARQPVTAGLLAIESVSAVAGRWRIDAAPLFATETGHFLGYQARLRRPSAIQPAPAANDDAAAAEASRSTDRLRQLLHELRTPINAIQGYSELIQQQIMGPTPHQYRSLAAAIASDAARMLAGFEDIERLIALEARVAGDRANDDMASESPDQPDLAALLSRLIAQLEPMLAPREAGLHCAVPPGPLIVAAPSAELERTLWRLLSVVAEAAATGEQLIIQAGIAPGGSAALLVLPLPAALAVQDDAALPATDGAAILGTGFALRLAAAEIRAAGGTFARKATALEIAIPLLTTVRQQLSQSEGSAGQAV